MDQKRDFTLSENFPLEEMQRFVNELHANGQHLIPIIDVGIPTHGNTDPFVRGMELGVFLKNADGSLFEGRVGQMYRFTAKC